MTGKKDKISRYHLGEQILIGYRDDHTLFWLKADKSYWDPKTDELNVIEAGNAWIDQKSNTTILDFPNLDKVGIHRFKNEFLQGSDWITNYKESDYYVQLSECLRHSPEKTEDEIIDDIDHDYELPEHIEGYILNEDTFLRKNKKLGKLYYIKFTLFSMNDFENDRFGWIRAARKYYSFSSDEELLSELKCFRKESYGDAWIDEKNDVVVLGPVYEQEPEVLDNYFADRICSYAGLYSEWNQTKCWIDIESGLKKNPFNYKVNYFYLLEKYMG